MNQPPIRILIASMLIMVSCLGLQAEDLSKYSVDQQLIIAAFELDVKKVESLLKEGANVNARMGKHGEKLFEDKWTLGYPISSGKWTPLIAVASSHRAPQPERRTENTEQGLTAAFEKMKSIDPKLIAERDVRRKAIAKLLIDAKAELDLDDGYGATALYEAVYNRFEDVAILLIESGAKIDTKTGIYIDGDDDISPIHRATDTPAVLQAMLKKEAKVNVAASDGSTPLHWAARRQNVKSVKLLLEAGADPNAKDNEGRIAAYWCRSLGASLPGDAEKEQIAKLLQAAAKPKK